LKALGYCALYTAVALIIFSPWAIRNYAWTRNPVYPLFSQIFQDPDVNPPPETDRENFGIAGDAAGGPQLLFTPFATRKFVYGESWWQTLLIPVRIFFQGQDDKPEYFDGRLNPYLFLLPMLTFIFGRKTDPVRNTDSDHKAERNILLAFASLFILFAFLKADMRIRYVAPAIPPLVILSAFGLHDALAAIRDRFQGRWRALSRSAAVVIVLGMLCLNFSYILALYQRIDPFSYIGGRLSRDQYIERYRPEYAAIRFANQHLPQNAKILGLFLGNRSYYSDRKLVFGENFFKRTVLVETSGQKIAAALKTRKITHILVYYRIFNPWTGHNFDRQERTNLSDFFNNHANLIFSKGGFGLYQL
jgi:hypothetical protein